MAVDRLKKGTEQAERTRRQIISQFAGLVVDMDYILCIPSVHARYQSEEIVVDYTGETRMKSDRFPPDKEALLIGWVLAHENEIYQNHQRIGHGVEPLLMIDPPKGEIG